jgi:hypothetical protein
MTENSHMLRSFCSSRIKPSAARAFRSARGAPNPLGSPLVEKTCSRIGPHESNHKKLLAGRDAAMRLYERTEKLYLMIF